MKRFVIGCWIFAALSAQAQTNQPAAKSLLLDEQTSFDLTAGLKQYDNVTPFKGRFSSVGGGSSVILVNRWATEFARLYPEIEIDFHGGGSENGVAGLVEGKVDIVPMSRPMHAEEIARFKAKFGYEPAQIVVAQDALGVYVNRKNPISNLTLAQLDSIYSRDSKRGGGRPEFWRDLGLTGPLAEQRIERINLYRVHGSQVYFREFVMQDEEYRFDVRFEPVPSSLVQAVGADDAAVGVASIMYATARTRFVPVQGADGSFVLPDYNNTLSGKYPLVRPLRIVFQRKPDGTMNAAAREFLRYAISRRGQRVIALAGTYPLTAEQQEEALRTIGDPPPPKKASR